MMEIKKNITGNQATLALSGRLDTNTAPDLDDAIFSLDDAVTELVLDFAALSFVSSAGLRVLVRAFDAMDDKDGSMVIHNVSDSIMEVFDVTGLSSLLVIE